MTAFSTRSLSGMTFAPLTESLGADVLTWFLAGFPARISAPWVKVQDSTESVQGFGAKCSGSLAKFDPHTSSWKIHQRSLFGGEYESLQTLPTWGMWENGELLGPVTLELRTKGTECGLWHPTPVRMDYKGANFRGEKQRESQLKEWLHVRFSQGMKTTYPHPLFLEQVMGWPIGWTELKPLAMGRFQQWLRSHGGR